jgi:uncharacterized protein DUF2846
MRVAISCAALSAAMATAAHPAQVKWQPLNSTQPVAAKPAPVATPDPSPTATPDATNASQAGKIIMYRGSSIVGSALACPIRYKGREIVELARGKYADWSVLPGRYILTNHTSSVEVAVDPGETRYVRCMIKMGMLVGRADLQIADEESFNEHRNQYEQKPVEIGNAR